MEQEIPTGMDNENAKLIDLNDTDDDSFLCCIIGGGGGKQS